MKIPKRNPLVRNQAERLTKFVVDRTLSAQGRIRPTMKFKKLAKVSVKAPNDKKFREYKIRNKKQISTPNVWIERRKFRLDFPSEVQTIQRFKKSAAFKKLLGRKKK